MLLNAVMDAQHKDTDQSDNYLSSSSIKTEDEEKVCFNKMMIAVAEKRDKQAFQKLFEHFAPRLKSFLMKGGSDESQADELAQETMLTIWQKAESFNPAQASASTWIFTIARNKKIDVLRKIKRHDYDPKELEIVESSKDNPDQVEQMSMATQTEVLSEAIEQLPKEQADLLKLSFFEELSHNEIAEKTNIALGTVKSRIRLALERLRGDSKVKILWD